MKRVGPPAVVVLAVVVASEPAWERAAEKERYRWARRVCVCSPTRLHAEPSAVDPLPGSRVGQRTVLGRGEGEPAWLPLADISLALSLGAVASVEPRWSRLHEGQGDAVRMALQHAAIGEGLRLAAGA
jgi:hypothetical protein